MTIEDFEAQNCLSDSYKKVCSPQNIVIWNNGVARMSERGAAICLRGHLYMIYQSICSGGRGISPPPPRFSGLIKYLVDLITLHTLICLIRNLLGRVGLKVS